MSSKTYNSAIVLIPPEDCWDPIQAIRREHDRHVRRWMPHINLLYPFRPRVQFDAIEDELRRACSGIEPFEVSLAEFRHFHHGRQHYTLWLAPEPFAAIVRLQAALESVFLDCNDVSGHRQSFTPHLSVGQTRGQQAMTSLKAGLQTSWEELSFQVYQISLIWRHDPPDDVFRIDRRIALGAHPTPGTMPSRANHG